jgi:hypothetical protein
VILKDDMLPGEVVDYTCQGEGLRVRLPRKRQIPSSAQVIGAKPLKTSPGV